MEGGGAIRGGGEGEGEIRLDPNQCGVRGRSEYDGRIRMLRVLCYPCLHLSIPKLRSNGSTRVLAPRSHPGAQASISYFQSVSAETMELD